MNVDTEGIQRLQVVNWDTANCLNAYMFATLIMIGDSIYTAPELYSVTMDLSIETFNLSIVCNA